MPFELEALVGHLYVVGGKMIKTTPPGALVEVAPGRAARGREFDTFFALVAPSGTLAPNTFYEQMALMAAERFFGVTGSVTAALRDVFNTLNNNLYEHNQSGRRHYEASMLCAVLRNDELYIARVGAAVAVLRYSGETLTYPEDITNDEMLYQPPLGVQPIPMVHMKRFVVDSGTRLLMADSALAEIPVDKLSQALVTANLEQVLNDLKLVVLSNVRLMAIELVPPEVVVPVPVVTGESTAMIATEIAAVRSQQATTPIATEATPILTKRERRRLDHHLRQQTGEVVVSAGKSVSALGEVAGKLFARPIDSTRPRLSPTFLMAAVIALPVMIVMIVVVAWSGQIGVSDFEACLNRASEAAAFARTVDSSTPGSVLAAWEATLEVTRSCETLRENDPAIAALLAEGRNVIDRVNEISRRDATVLASFPDARLKSLVLQGLDLYALDSQNSLVYRVQIGADGVTTRSLPQPITRMQRGTTVDGLTVGDIVDIDYDATVAGAVLALDRTGVVVRCLPQFIMECEAQRVLGSETWQNPVRITLWNGNLYVLDPGANQIWRYQITAGDYQGLPTEYFAGSVRPNLTNAVDFDITTTGIGTVYILQGDGVMQAYLSGDAQPFAFADMPLTEFSAHSMFLNDSPIGKTIYIINQPAQTVYETTHSGTFMAQYQVFEDQAFELVADVVVEPAQRIMYVASGNTIFALKMDG